MRIPLNLTTVEEPKPVPNGRYDLVIAEAEEKRNKANTKDQIEVSIAISGHETAPNVRHYISLPSGDDEPQKANFKLLMLRRFLHAFSIPYDADGFDVQDFPGATASCDLALSEPDPETGNVYNRLQLPKLPSEGKEGVAHSTATRPPKR